MLQGVSLLYVTAYKRAHLNLCSTGSCFESRPCY